MYIAACPAFFYANDVSKNYNLAAGRISQNILPDPVDRMQGLPWKKPHHYIAVAIAMDDRIKNKDQLDQAVRRLEQGMSSPYLSS